MLPITLACAGAAALINLWLGVRIIRIRFRDRVSIGDGGNAALAARMRAHLNFAEYTPIVLILIGLIEMARGSSGWLAAAGALYVLGRIGHAIGMDGSLRARQFGTLATLTLTGVLGLAALYLALAPAPARPIGPPTPAIGQG
jgi:uncharacterized protein